MKKLTIGRNNACDIIIPDTSDIVSRKQAVLACYFWGKMVLYDTSNNGTYINGEKLGNGKGRRVTRKDKVNFARVADLNWNEVKDPYRKAKLFYAIGAAVLVLGILPMAFWLSQPKEVPVAPANTEISGPTGETYTTVEPEPVKVNEPAKRPTTPKKPKRRANDDKDKPVNDRVYKEVNDNSPIVY